ncbi:MAG: CopG family transcriptional regulator [Oligoflexia bacterium]|nr:CopG family transcriptional regulator [Oligoflexia bacterium]
MNGKLVSVVLPPELDSAVVKLAKKEHRNVSDLFREALRQYIARSVVHEIRVEAKKIKNEITPEDIEEIIDEDRK